MYASYVAFEVPEAFVELERICVPFFDRSLFGVRFATCFSLRRTSQEDAGIACG